MYTIRIPNARVLPNHGYEQGDALVIEVADLTPVAFSGHSNMKIVNPETGVEREFSDQEIRDFEVMLDEFADLQVGRALAKLIRRGG